MWYQTSVLVTVSSRLAEMDEDIVKKCAALIANTVPKDRWTATLNASARTTCGLNCRSSWSTLYNWGVGGWFRYQFRALFMMPDKVLYQHDFVMLNAGFLKVNWMMFYTLPHILTIQALYGAVKMQPIMNGYINYWSNYAKNIHSDMVKFINASQQD